MPAGGACAAALGRLVPEQREAFLLKYVEELSYEEMAELTGAGESALRCGSSAPASGCAIF